MDNLSEFYSEEEPQPKTFSDKAREVFSRENFRELYNKLRQWFVHKPDEDIVRDPAKQFFYDLEIDSAGHTIYRMSQPRFSISERFASGTIKIHRSLSSVSASPLVYCMANLSEQSAATGRQKAEVRPLIISFNCGTHLGSDIASDMNTVIFFSERRYDEAVEMHLGLFSKINCRYYIIVCADEGEFSEAAIFCR
jgi:hypothetical protein